MHFTAGAPLRILADALDANAWVCPPGHPPYVCPGSEERFYVDGQLVGTAAPSVNDFNLWELRLPNGLAQGDHVLTVKFVPYNPSTGGGGTPINGLVPVTIHVDAAPVRGGTVTLAQNLVLSGSTNLDWTDKTVIGNGFRVTSAAGYSGKVIIQGSVIRGLGSFSTPGISVATSGSVSIQDSIFEATGAMQFATQGGAAVTVRNNELRANNLITYVADDPSVPVVAGAERPATPAPRSSRATASAEACFASTAATDGRSADWPPVRGTCSSASGPSSTWSTRRTI